MNRIEVRMADWLADYAELSRIREAVFVIEQSVPAELEWDGEDSEAIHFLACEDGYPVGTARLLKDGHIGRVAVLKDWRGLKAGEQLVSAAVKEAERLGFTRQYLSAQVHAKRFYERLGFQAEGAEYLDAGILHVDMFRDSE
ncbi:GNAT family N-acetyltransferase [Pseudomonas matsuisoli]|nr:GNAT family N-acetyltransferase [Pseudomonas matsuisoli]